MNMPHDENENLESEFSQPKKKSYRGKSFYVALAICMVALSAAAWSTYESVKDFIAPSKNQSSVQSIPKSSDKVTKSVPDKTNIIEEKKDEKPTSRNRKLIPYDASAKDTMPKSKEKNEEITSVSAPKSDTLVIYPVGNNISKEYSDGKPAYSKTMNDWRSHDGTDFQTNTGSLVKSITDGTVKDIYQDPSYGMTIVIEHDPQFTAYYSGLGTTVLVEKGKRVKSGEEIGSVAEVPCESSDEPHLHLAVSKNDKFIDPLLIFEK